MKLTRDFPGRFDMLEEIGVLIVQTAKDAGFNSNDCYAMQLRLMRPALILSNMVMVGKIRGRLSAPVT